MNRLCTFLALAGVLVVAACDDQPTSPRETQGPSAAIYDADHDGDNKEVFFLPPIVPNPTASPFFKPGEFNPNLTSAVIRVCHMVNNACAAVVASFGAGQATGPIVISTIDEHYLAVWHTDQSDLVAGQAYRIEVFMDGDVTSAPVAWADVTVASTMKELKNLNTNETIALLDGRTLPIKVRFQNGVRCESDNCLSQRVTAEGGNLILESGNGALVLQEGWLPPGITEVTVTLQRHATGPGNDCVGNAAYIGPGLVAQREACLEVTTDPVLLPGATTGIQRPAFIFLCTEASETDPLRQFLQIIKADDGLPLEALTDVSDDDLIALGFDPSCEGTPSEIGLSSHPLMRLASRGLNAVARLLEVKRAYAIDLGQGGEIPIGGFFSHFTLGVMGTAAAFGTTPETAETGSTVPLSVQMMGLTRHPPSPPLADGLAGISVAFAITAGAGGLSDPATELDPGSSVTVLTNADGVATANLSVGNGANVVKAVALVAGQPVSDTVTFAVDGVVIAPNLSVVMQVPDNAPPLSPSVIAAGEQVTLHPWLIQNLGGPVAPSTGSFSYGFYLSNDAIITASDTRLGGASVSNATFNTSGPLTFAAPTLTIPLSTTPGVKYVGILVDEGNDVADSDRSSNVVGGIPLTIEVLTGGATDPTGDGGETPGSSNDLISVTATASSGTLTMHFRYATDTRDPAFKLITGIDTDENPATGHQGIDSGCTRDNGVLGADYLVRAEASGVTVYQYVGPCNQFNGVGAGTLALDADGDGFVVTVPLSLLGGDSGRLRFKATSGSGGSGIYDVITNDGAAPVRVGSPIID
ncbi:MAG TPA: hypothetical protein VFU01_19300 [Gemmatimonadaceae bacterium]|nr:hypothetical protein [Gemmatimonadaceae bacterium]